MRWDTLVDGDAHGAPSAGRRTLPLLPRGSVTRTFDTPEFRGITVHEVTARSALNKVPEASRVPFRWTVNPYRGCTMACAYCFARKTHEYLDLDSGHDFDNQIVVKTNVGDLLRRELARPSWRGEHVAMGTNVDCYQRLEGRYRLMPQIIAALSEAANPFSILTKSALILRDLPLLRQAAQATSVSTALSVGCLDRGLRALAEPGAPPPARRLEVVRRLADAGIPTGVLMAPILPFLSDTEEQLDRAVAAVAASGAAYVTPIVLHLRPGAREWWLRWLSTHRPDLLPRYAELYRRGTYADQEYQERITGTVRRLAADHGVGGERVKAAPLVRPARPPGARATQLALL